MSRRTGQKQAARVVREQIAKENRRRRTLWTSAIAVAALVIAGLIGWGVYASQNSGDVVPPPNATATAGITVGSGPVTVEVYEDFICPACKAFEDQSGQTLDQLVAANKVKIVYYPLAFLDRQSSTDYSTRAAAASACADEGGKFREYAEALFARQPAEGSAGLSDGELIVDRHVGRAVGVVVRPVRQRRQVQAVGGLDHRRGQCQRRQQHADREGQRHAGHRPHAGRPQRGGERGGVRRLIGAAAAGFLAAVVLSSPGVGARGRRPGRHELPHRGLRGRAAADRRDRAGGRGRRAAGAGQPRPAAPVEVLGYDGEPYLSVRPDGVYENVHSPAVYLNATLAGTATLPPEADATLPPSWRKVSSSPVARWHDARTHWLLARPAARGRRRAGPGASGAGLGGAAAGRHVHDGGTGDARLAAAAVAGAVVGRRRGGGARGRRARPRAAWVHCGRSARR